MDRNSLTFQTFKNTTYNIIGYIWPMILTLVVTPIIIFTLGLKDYGIYIFINTILSLFGLLDLGFGVAVSKYMASYFGKKDRQAISTLTSTANSLFLLMGILGLAISVIIYIFGSKILPASASAYSGYFPLILITGAIFFVNTIDSSYSSVLFAVQRFDISNYIGIVSITTSSIGLLATALLGGSLEMIFLVQLAIAAGVSIATIITAKRVLPEARFSFSWNSAEIKKCYSFGLVSFVNNIANSALLYLDRLIIPFFVGPSSLTYYSLPGNITNKIPGLSNTLSTTVFPTASQLDGANEKERIATLYIRSFRLIIIAASALTITAIAFAHQTLSIWLSPDFALHSTEILIILAATNFILSMLGPLSGFLLGLGKVRFLTIMSVVMGMLNAILLILFLPRYGITGAAWAYLISVLPVAYMFYHTETHYLVLVKRKKHYLKTFTGVIVVSGMIWVLDTFLLSFLVVNLVTLLCVGAISVLIFIILYRLFGFFEDRDWQDIETFLLVLFHKIKK